jgi:tRNA threonylcarbamoyladenosine biosynthesis protein TsaB
VNILGFDTATAATAVCVVPDGGNPVELAPRAGRLHESPAHARELMPAVARAMERAGVRFEDLDAVAVGIGPGGFTGLRIGVATARALAGAAGAELRPVPSLAALAAGIESKLRLPLVDARRGELFAALYENGEERWARFAASPDELAERVRKSGFSPLAAGDGAVRFREVLEAAGIAVEPADSPAHVVRALHVCRLAVDAPATPPEAVLPDYLRLPDARAR